MAAHPSSEVHKPLIDEEHDDITDLQDDPLVKQLPTELLEFVIYPKDSRGTVQYVNRVGVYATAHSVMSVLGAFCCCYSCCKMVVVKQGQIALTQNSEIPEMLGPGRHVLLSPLNTLTEIKNVTDREIRHGPFHIIRIEMGQLGYGVNIKTGRPIILARGKHVINDINFVWKKRINLSQRVTSLGELQIIRITTGYVGYAYRKGNLVILKPGLHLIEPPDRFGNVLSTQMQIIDLEEAVHDTSDYVPLRIKAAIFFRILQPELALRRISNIEQQITDTAVATLAGIIRASSLSDIASRSQPVYQRTTKTKAIANENGLDTEPSAPPFFQHVHDEFIQQLHDHVLDEWGIEIQNLRIESLKIHDAHLQKSIANQAIEVSKQHNKYLMLQKKSEIVMVEANAKAEKSKIETDSSARTTRSKAQADADAVIIAAEAQKASMELKGSAEAEYARLLESTKLGNAMSTMKIQSDALKRLDQVAYIPYLPNILAEDVGIFAGNSNKNEFIE